MRDLNLLRLLTNSFTCILEYDMTQRFMKQMGKQIQKDVSINAVFYCHLQNMVKNRSNACCEVFILRLDNVEAKSE